MIKKQMRIAIACALLLTCHTSFSATLTAVSFEPSKDGTGLLVPVALHVGAGDQVAALQFEVSFDRRMLELVSVKAGPGAEAVQKLVTSAALESGRIRVVIAGLNREVMTTGNVAILEFIAPELEPDATKLLKLENVKLCDPRGAPISAETDYPGRDTHEEEAQFAAPKEGKTSNNSITAMVALVMLGIPSIFLVRHFRERARERHTQTEC